MQNENKKVIKFVVDEGENGLSIEFIPNITEADLMATAGVLLQIVSDSTEIPLKKVAKDFYKMLKA